MCIWKFLFDNNLGRHFFIRRKFVTFIENLTFFRVYCIYNINEMLKLIKKGINQFFFVNLLKIYHCDDLKIENFVEIHNSLHKICNFHVQSLLKRNIIHKKKIYNTPKVS